MKKKQKKQSQDPQLFFEDPEAELAEELDGKPKGMPALSMIQLETRRLGLPDSDAEFLFDAWLMNGFKTGRGPVRDWRAAVRVWYAKKWYPSQREASRQAISNELTEVAIDQLEKKFPRLAPIREFLDAARRACATSHRDGRPMGRAYFAQYLQRLSEEPPGLVAHQRTKPKMLREAKRDRVASDEERKRGAEELRKFRKSL